MTAERTIQLACDCPGPHPDSHTCQVTYPPRPAEGTAKDLRADAEAAGWQVVQHTTGEDICPPCRIARIEAAARSAVPTGQVAP